MKPKTIIASAAIVDNKEIISPAVIKIKDGVITEISDQLPQQRDQNTIELKNTVLLPGFVNAHCHLELTGIGPLQNNTFVPWIKDLVTRKIEQSEDDLASSVTQGIDLLKNSGVTTVFDHISFNTSPSVFENSPLRIIGFGESLGAVPEVGEMIYQNLKLLKKSAPIPYHISPHSIHSLAAKTLKAVFETESKPFSTHLCETKEEQEYFTSHTGDMCDFIFEHCPDLKNTVQHKAPSAIQFIHNNQWNMDNSLIVHANYIDDIDLEIIEKWENACVVHCPGSFEYFKHERFPLDEIKKRNIPVALGTDSYTSNTEFNYLHEIQIFLKNFSVKTIFELLPLITTNACQAIGLTDVGKIQKGYQADMIGFEIKDGEEILEQLKKRKDVDFMMISGEVLSQ